MLDAYVTHVKQLWPTTGTRASVMASMARRKPTLQCTNNNQGRFVSVHSAHCTHAHTHVYNVLGCNLLLHLA